MTEFEQHLKDLSETIIELGFSSLEAKTLIDMKTEYFTQHTWKVAQRLKEYINVPKLYPLDVLQGYRLTDEFLWGLGLNTKKVKPVIDIGLITYNDKRVLCKYIVCSERTDREWCTLLIDDVNVASWEARMASSKDGSLMQELRGMMRGQVTNPKKDGGKVFD